MKTTITYNGGNFADEGQRILVYYASGRWSGIIYNAWDESPSQELTIPNWFEMPEDALNWAKGFAYGRRLGYTKIEIIY